jgi:hypothetical protein
VLESKVLAEVLTAVELRRVEGGVRVWEWGLATERASTSAAATASPPGDSLTYRGPWQARDNKGQMETELTKLGMRTMRRRMGMTMWGLWVEEGARRRGL